MSSERLTGTVNLTTTLQYQFRKWGDAYDANSITNVRIYPTYNDAVNETNIIETITTISKIGTGLYEYDVAPISNAGIYYDKITLVPDAGEDPWTDISSFTIADTGIAPSGETRKGYAFNNPDFTSKGNWGAIIHPDELRYVYAFGNELVAPNSQTITDDTLWWYINNAISHVERDLKIKILKKIYKYRPKRGETRQPFDDSEAEFTGSVDLSRAIDLSSEYLLKLAIDKGTYYEVNLQGATPVQQH